jgi:hypothetical protein
LRVRGPDGAHEFGAKSETDEAAQLDDGFRKAQALK